MSLAAGDDDYKIVLQLEVNGALPLAKQRSGLEDKILGQGVGVVVRPALENVFDFLAPNEEPTIPTHATVLLVPPLQTDHDCIGLEMLRLELSGLENQFLSHSAVLSKFQQKLLPPLKNLPLFGESQGVVRAGVGFYHKVMEIGDLLRRLHVILEIGKDVPFEGAFRGPAPAIDSPS